MRPSQWLMVLLGAAAIGPNGQAADEMSVQVKSTQVRDSDSYLGKPLYELHFGDRVTVVQKGAAWMKVQPVNTAAVKFSAGVPDDAKTYVGYVNKSALTTKRVVLKADQNAQLAASSEDVALAGKGFNDEVERAYQAEHPNLATAFTTLNHIETDAVYTPSAADISAFRAAGGLNGGGQ